MEQSDCSPVTGVTPDSLMRHYGVDVDFYCDQGVPEMITIMYKIPLYNTCHYNCRGIDFTVRIVRWKVLGYHEERRGYATEQVCREDIIKCSALIQPRLKPPNQPSRTGLESVRSLSLHFDYRAACPARG